MPHSETLKIIGEELRNVADNSGASDLTRGILHCLAKALENAHRRLSRCDYCGSIDHEACR